VSLAGWLLVLVGTVAVVCGGAVLALVAAGRRSDVRALAGFLPDCMVLARRLLSDSRVPRGRKLLPALLVGYLALPFDVVPDFIPIAGQLDDAVVVAWVLRAILRGGGPELLREHWPGPERSRRLVERLAFGAVA
jgi:uncharacterized membrane protein YkvA (DUF1232 family)